METSQEKAITRLQEPHSKLAGHTGPGKSGTGSWVIERHECTQKRHSIPDEEGTSWRGACNNWGSRARRFECDDGLAAGINGLLSTPSNRPKPSSPQFLSSPRKPYRSDRWRGLGTLLDAKNVLKQRNALQRGGDAMVPNQSLRSFHDTDMKTPWSHCHRSKLRINARIPSYAGMTCSASHKRKLLPKTKNET